MGLRRKLAQFVGANSKKILSDGLPGQAQVIDVKRTQMSSSQGGDPAFSEHRVYRFTLQVTLQDNTAPYTARVRRAVSRNDLTRLTPGSTVAVRVDRRERSYVALDLNG